MWGYQHNANAIGVGEAVQSCATVVTADTQRKKRRLRLASIGTKRNLDINKGHQSRAIPSYS